MSTTVDALKAKLSDIALNPSQIQRAVYDMLDEFTDGTTEITNPTSPLVAALVTSAVCVSSAIDKATALVRERYAVLAQTEDEVYLHMSDNDFVGRFATPAVDKFCLMFRRSEVIAAMVEDPDTGIRKMVIPRDSYVTVAGYTFSLQYPIEIRQMLHDGLVVVYDVEKTSPLQTISSNVLNWEYRRGNDDVYIWIEVELSQFVLTSKQEGVSSGTLFTMSITYSDYFYYARVYHSNADGTWTELKTTHTDQVFDVTTPTAVLKVNQNNKTLDVTIPQIYTVTGVISNKIRVDTYTTTGPISLDLSNYATDAFVATWRSVDENEVSNYTTAIKGLTFSMVYSLANINGGTTAMSFDTLRSRVISGSVGDIVIPITPANLDSEINEEFDVVKNVDVLTDRIFLAARGLPAPSDQSTSTGIAMLIGSCREHMASMASLSGVVDNGNRVTIKSRSLFKLDSGVVTHCPSSEYDRLMALGVDDRALEITTNQYLFNPYYYVMDASTTQFDLRAYDLDNPEIASKVFVQENDTTLVEVTTIQYAIEKRATGYRLLLLTTSDDGFKAIDDLDIQVQIAFTPPGDTAMTYLNGTLAETTSDGERYYSFDIETNYDVNSDAELSLTNFLTADMTARAYSTALTTTLHVFYTSRAVRTGAWERSEIDDLLGMHLLDQNAAAISHESMVITFGSDLDNLWRRARTVVGETQYETYDAAVYATYKQNVYEINTDTGTTIFIDVDGKPYQTILHNEGDRIKDASGQDVILHNVGDVKLDADNNPIPLTGRRLVREIDLLAMDGAYLFATTPAVVSYVDTVIATLTDWITDNLQDIEDRLLEKTSIYYYPKVGVGQIKALVDDATESSIDAAQSLTITLTVSETVINDTDLKLAITAKTAPVIATEFEKQRIALTEIISSLKEAYGDDVIDVSITGLGGGSARVITLISNSDRCSIGKRLVSQSSGLLSIEDDITVNFVRHRNT